MDTALDGEVTVHMKTRITFKRVRRLLSYSNVSTRIFCPLFRAIKSLGIFSSGFTSSEIFEDFSEKGKLLQTVFREI